MHYIGRVHVADCVCDLEDEGRRVALRERNPLARDSGESLEQVSILQELQSHVIVRVILEEIEHSHDIRMGDMLQDSQFLLHQRSIDLSLVHFTLGDYFDGARHLSVDVTRFIDFAELACAELSLKVVLILNVVDFMESFRRLKLQESFSTPADQLRVLIHILNPLTTPHIHRDWFWLRWFRKLLEIFN